MGLVAVYIDTVNTFDEAIRLNATVFILLILLFLHHPVNRNTALLKKHTQSLDLKRQSL